MDLNTFVKLIFNEEKEPLNLYSECEYRLMAEKIIEEIIEENEDYYNAARIFCMYPAQKWAQTTRKELKLDAASLQKALDSDTEYFGIYARSNLSLQLKNLKLTDEILKYVEFIIFSSALSNPEKAVIDAVFTNGKTSKYLLNQYLKPAMLKLFEESYREFDRYTEKINHFVEEVDDELYVAYHSIEDFLYSVRQMKDDRIHSYDLNSKITFSTMKEAINTLKKYPYSKDVYRIVSSIFCGKAESSIAKDLNRSRTYVHSHCVDGYKALNILFWGYGEK